MYPISHPGSTNEETLASYPELMNISSVESQKGVIADQRRSVENQKGTIAVQSLWR